MQKLGVFWKIQDICYIMGTEIFKIEEEMTEKMKPHVVNPPSKMSRIHCKFWMSLRVVVAIFRRKDIFLGHPV